MRKNPNVMNGNNWRIGLLGLVVSAAAVYFIYTQIDVSLLGDALATARYIYVLPCLLLLLLGLVTRAMRWRLLLGGALPLWRTFSIMNVAYLVNGVLPLRIGEVARVYLAYRAEPPVPVFKTTSTIVAERLLDLLAVTLMALMALAVSPIPDEIRASAMLLGPLAVVGFVTLVLLARYRPLTERLIAAIVQRLPRLERLQGWAGQFLDGLAPLGQPGRMFGALGMTALSWGVSACAGYVLMFAFYEQASWAATLLYIAAAAFAIAVPAVPGNIGTYEAAILVALNATGYRAFEGGEAATVALSFAVMVHAVNLFVHATTGVVGFVQEGISLQQLSRGVSEMQQLSSDATMGKL